MKQAPDDNTYMVLLHHSGPSLQDENTADPSIVSEITVAAHVLLPVGMLQPLAPECRFGLPRSLS